MELTAEAIQQQIADAIKQNMESAVTNALDSRLAQQQQQPDTSNQQTQQQQPEQRSAFDDIVAPYFHQANFVAAAANDKADFYTSYTVVKDGDEDEGDLTLSRSMRQDIEKTFNNLAKEGRPQTREAIYHYLVGKKVATDNKGYLEGKEKKKKAQLDAAKEGLDIGSSNSVLNFTMDDLRGMAPDKLKETLADVTF